MVVRLIVGCVLTGAALVAGDAVGLSLSRVGFIWDPAALAAMFIVPPLICLLGFGPARCGALIRAARGSAPLRRSGQMGEGWMGEARVALRGLGFSLFLLSLLGLLANTISVMVNLQDKGRVMYCLARGLLPGLYALALYASLASPLGAWLEWRAASSSVKGEGLAEPWKLESPGARVARLILGGLGGLGAILLILGLGYGMLIHFFDLSSKILVLTVPLAALVAWPGPMASAKAIWAGIRGPRDMEEARLSGAVLSHSRRSLYLGGGLGLYLGTANFLAYGVMDLRLAGPSLAIALISPLLALALDLCVCLPLSISLRASGANP